ncbi:MAG: rRNA maturation RNase YbeY [Gammaproteobacteria bacterium]
MRRISIDVQYACSAAGLPGRKQIASWVRAALRDGAKNAELTVRIVSEPEAAELNQRWRGIEGATNVLSFPATGLEGIAPGLLGDVVICATVVKREAEQQGKTLKAHWAHMVIHGTLHLLGHDHQDKSQAGIMEALETDILGELGFQNPYE